MKRTASDLSPRRASPLTQSPARSPPQSPPRSPPASSSDTEAFEDSSEDSSVHPIEQLWSVMNDASKSTAEREAAVRTCIGSLPIGQRRGIFSFETEHWQVLEAITLLEMPQECAELFVASYLKADFPLQPAGILHGLTVVKAARSALGGLAMCPTRDGRSLVVKHVMEMATLCAVCPITCRSLLAMAFRGHESLLADVHAVFCEEIERRPRPSVQICIVALASLHSLSGANPLDVTKGPQSLCAESLILHELVRISVQQCCAIIHVAQTLQLGQALERGDFERVKTNAGEVRALMGSNANEEGIGEFLQAAGLVQAWSVSLMYQLTN